MAFWGLGIWSLDVGWAPRPASPPFPFTVSGPLLSSSLTFFPLVTPPSPPPLPPPPLTVLRKLIEFGAQSLLNPRAAARAWISSAEAPSAPAVRSTWKAANLPVLGFRARSSSCRKGGWSEGRCWASERAPPPAGRGGAQAVLLPTGTHPPCRERSHTPPPPHRASTPLPFPLPLAPGTQPPPPLSSPVAYPPPLPAGATPPFPSPRG